MIIGELNVDGIVGAKIDALKKDLEFEGKIYHCINRYRYSIWKL